MRTTKPQPFFFPSLVVPIFLGFGTLILSSCRTNQSRPDSTPAAKQPVSDYSYRPSTKKSSSSTRKSTQKPTEIKSAQNTPVLPPIPTGNNKEIVVNENEANRIITASGEDISVSGDNGLILITGKCRNLKITGSNNQVQSDIVERVRISGNRNSVVAGNLGGGNLSGNSNQLTWENGINGLRPAIEITGSDNETTALN